MFMSEISRNPELDSEVVEIRTLKAGEPSEWYRALGKDLKITAVEGSGEVEIAEQCPQPLVEGQTMSLPTVDFRVVGAMDGVTYLLEERKI